jgi:hypothetical protein
MLARSRNDDRAAAERAACGLVAQHETISGKRHGAAA